MPILEFLIRLSAGLLMGMCVGLERRWRQRMAGTRTNALVAAGAAAFVMCGIPPAAKRKLYPTLYPALASSARG